MKWIRQKHKLGCASASLAMIAGISYDEAIALVHPDRKKGARVCTTVSNIAAVMANLGITTDVRYNPASEMQQQNMYWTLSDLRRSHNRIIWLGDWLGRPAEPAMLTVWMEPYIPWRHAVVWDGAKILDPMLHPAKKNIDDAVYFKNLVSAILVKK